MEEKMYISSLSEQMDEMKKGSANFGRQAEPTITREMLFLCLM